MYWRYWDRMIRQLLWKLYVTLDYRWIPLYCDCGEVKELYDSIKRHTPLVFVLLDQSNRTDSTSLNRKVFAQFKALIISLNCSLCRVCGLRGSDVPVCARFGCVMRTITFRFRFLASAYTHMLALLRPIPEMTFFQNLKNNNGNNALLRWMSD